MRKLAVFLAGAIVSSAALPALAQEAQVSVTHAIDGRDNGSQLLKCRMFDFQLDIQSFFNHVLHANLVIDDKRQQRVHLGFCSCDIKRTREFDNELGQGKA